ncbi:DUF928 domain-containing protein [Methylomonas sp. LL1]|uniref:DUF928 domain-containing protein n=1 Tax=Methylomonas sp. LL1 TaxID=2785785 RepID=UPI0018C3B16C|nr:DUF928 domain-containing protein [Methylomonas sp. LL1]QPK63696.1 DUF928 domain-containing protein [Methylomonas sp. LL1]
MHKKIMPLLVLASLTPNWANAEGLLLYKPPQTGAPAARIGGGTRGLSLSVANIQVLAPQQMALTGEAQPVLYWYASEASQQWIEITLLKDGTDQPVLQKQLPPIASAGLQSFSLADHDVSLEAGQDYHWSVALINDVENLKQETSKAGLRYQMPPSKLNSAEKLAEAGYWYDALQQLVESRSPRANELLSQIGLSVSLW